MSTNRNVAEANSESVAGEIDGKSDAKVAGGGGHEYNLNQRGADDDASDPTPESLVDAVLDQCVRDVWSSVDRNVATDSKGEKSKQRERKKRTEEDRDVTTASTGEKSKQRERKKRTEEDRDVTTASKGEKSKQRERKKRTEEERDEFFSQRPEWLPDDWSMEVKKRTNGRHAGMIDRYYINPATGQRFRSRVQVLEFLKTGGVSQSKKGGPKVHRKRKYAGTLPSGKDEGFSAPHDASDHVHTLQTCDQMSSKNVRKRRKIGARKRIVHAQKSSPNMDLDRTSEPEQSEMGVEEAYKDSSEAEKNLQNEEAETEDRGLFSPN